MTAELQLAFYSVFANWRHSLASLASIVLGLMAVAAIHGYNVECEQQFSEISVYRAMTGHIIIEAQQTGDDRIEIEDGTAALILKSTDALGDKILSVVRFLGINGIIAGSRTSFPYTGFAYDVVQGEIARGPKWAMNTPYGHPLTRNGTNEIVVGKGLAELLGCKLGHEPKQLSSGNYLPSDEALDCSQHSMQLTGLTRSNKINTWEAPIVGIVDASVRQLDDNWLMMPLDHGQIFSHTKQVTMIGITLKNRDDYSFMIDHLKDDLRAIKPPLKISFWKDHENGSIYRSMMGVMRIFELFMLMIIAFVCVLSMINTTIRNVESRIHEIGTLRAIGYKKAFVIRVFAWEGFFLGIAGSVLGIIGIMMVSKVLNAAGIMYLPAIISQKIPLRIAYTPETYLILALFLSLCSALTAAIVTKLKISRSISTLLQSHI